jgi:hypothetical protein
VSANEGGLQPLDYMLQVMRDPTASEARRDMMAKAAAPYRHPQLQAVAHKHLNADGTPIAPHGEPHDHAAVRAEASADGGGYRSPNGLEDYPGVDP